MGRLEDGKEKGKKEKGGKEWEGRVRKERRGGLPLYFVQGPLSP